LQFYEEFVEEMWLPSDDYNTDMARAALGVAGEAGELADKIKKWFRGDSIESFDWNHEIEREVGDVLFYLVKVAHLHKFTLREAMITNMEKLSSRKKRGQLQGSGDNR
jgi:NTP pyrophosphatase (non-canonical NTP hydrolase)